MPVLVHFSKDQQGEETERMEQNSVFGSAEAAWTSLFIPCLASAAIPCATFNGWAVNERSMLVSVLLRFRKNNLAIPMASAGSRSCVHKMHFLRHLHLSDSGACGKNPRIVRKITVHQMLPWWRCSMRWNCRNRTIPEVLSFFQKRKLQGVQLQNRLFTKFRLALDSTSISCKLCCFRTCLWTKFWPSLRSWRNELYSDSSVCSLQHLSFGAVDFFPKKFWQFHCLLLLQSGVADRKAKVGAPCVHMGASVEHVALSCGLCLSIPPIKVCGCHAVVGLPVPHSDQ